MASSKASKKSGKGGKGAKAGKGAKGAIAGKATKAGKANKNVKADKAAKGSITGKARSGSKVSKTSKGSVTSKTGSPKASVVTKASTTSATPKSPPASSPKPQSKSRSTSRIKSSSGHVSRMSEIGSFITVSLMCIAFILLLVSLLLFIFHNMLREETIEHFRCPRPIQLLVRRNERSPETYMISLHNATCDYDFRQAWYRFDSPNGNMRMPERPMLPGMCNTGVPFWFLGTHPQNMSLPMPAIACGTLDNDGCKFYANIRVQNCGTYMAYYLQPLPKCYMAYCMEDFLAEDEQPDGGDQDKANSGTGANTTEQNPLTFP